ncbi:TSUP family transporter [Photobacterium ganghwense]|uniref:sulfite exporter TauE/SafE family protein n=1 Tax=Photobacterium ganghwense TaxID=320778 RepID=UPI001A8F66DF|nr:sulfite exporter TauE/SafE family protein [Photobacterium ganghwense]QSV16640.1 sulfite exporter TauE/SafE family protein [Photobacterium ganghwense]
MLADFALSVTDLLSLGTFTIMTSVVAAVLGFGGGMLLIAIMPFYLPAAAIIPVHGATQMVSNISRAMFSWREVCWSLLPSYLIGAITGTLLVGLTAVSLATEYLPLFIGSYILMNIWHQGFMRWVSRFESMFLAGFILSGLSLLVGAPGPLFHPMMMKKLSDKNHLVATTAMMMTIAHGLKLILFGLVGFNYLSQWPLLTTLVLCAILGSWLGTRVRHRSQNQHVLLLIKIILSLLALKMMLSVWLTYQ